MKVYVDSDVIISSFLSKKGASHLLLNASLSPAPIYYISNYSIREITDVCKRLKINKLKLSKLIKTVKIIDINKKEIKKYEKYTLDLDDTHIVAGAHKSKSNYLITFNLKHYKENKLKSDLKIICMTPGSFLQFLRSKN